MLKIHLIKEAEKYKNYCSEKKIKHLKNIFDKCLDKNNNKIENCQDYRYKLEKCYNLLEKRKFQKT